MTPDEIVQHAADMSLVLLSIALLLTAFRVVKGPTLPDRVLALDMIVAVGVGFIIVIAVRTGFTLYIDIAIARIMFINGFPNFYGFNVRCTIHGYRLHGTVGCR